MFFTSAVVALLAATVSAFPAADPAEAEGALVARQSSSSDELESGPCRQVTFIFARGSTETGNMVGEVKISFSWILTLT